MNNKQLKIEINHILESGANDIRLIELFERYAQTETSATEILRLKDADAHNEEIQHYQTQLASANKRIEQLESALHKIMELADDGASLKLIYDGAEEALNK